MKWSTSIEQHLMSTWVNILRQIIEVGQTAVLVKLGLGKIPIFFSRNNSESFSMSWNILPIGGEELSPDSGQS